MGSTRSFHLLDEQYCGRLKYAAQEGKNMRIYTDEENLVSIALGVILGLIIFVVRNCL
jgi:hypothetical protein